MRRKHLTDHGSARRSFSRSPVAIASGPKSTQASCAQRSLSKTLLRIYPGGLRQMAVYRADDPALCRSSMSAQVRVIQSPFRAAGPPGPRLHAYTFIPSCNKEAKKVYVTGRQLPLEFIPQLEEGALAPGFASPSSLPLELGQVLEAFSKPSPVIILRLTLWEGSEPLPGPICL